MRHYLATIEASIQIKDRERSLENVLRSANLPGGMEIQDIDTVVWESATQAAVRLALIVPSGEDGDVQDIEVSLMDTEIKICRGTMTITTVYEIDLFDETWD